MWRRVVRVDAEEKRELSSIFEMCLNGGHERKHCVSEREQSWPQLAALAHV